MPALRRLNAPTTRQAATGHKRLRLRQRSPRQRLSKFGGHPCDRVPTSPPTGAAALPTPSGNCRQDRLMAPPVTAPPSRVLGVRGSCPRHHRHHLLLATRVNVPRGILLCFAVIVSAECEPLVHRLAPAECSCRIGIILPVPPNGSSVLAKTLGLSCDIDGEAAIGSCQRTYHRRTKAIGSVL
ncbi:hypothetical protein HPB50_015780 [Hyalomma asiaticum]|uniref:Uncharacterized protein n=1 Tax=Hyalomma asiaticum TaxID=266040 RepID=A0ACB7RU64_HYAAI|nr:hypothetical protein HPB50_015780 [Hyalomma asiaticum]